MSTETQTRHLDVTRPRFGAAHLALALAILSLPGSMLPWDWFTAGGLVIGVPLALAGLVLGVRARRAAAPGRPAARIALAAVVLSVAVLLIPVVWVTVAAVS